MKKVVFVLLCVMFISCVASAEVGPVMPTVLKFSHGVDANSHWHRGLLRLKELIEERTEGRYLLELYHSAQLGDERSQIESTLMGSQDAGVFAATVVSNTVPFLSAFDLPYIIRDQVHVEKILKGDLGKKIAQEIDKFGFKCLSVWAGGFRCIANNKKPIHTVVDISGMKIRTQMGRVHAAVWNALGASTVAMSWQDAYAAVQQGAVDGVEVNLSLIRSLSVYEVCKYLAISNEQYTICPVLMSSRAWNKLSSEDQKIFLDTTEEVMHYEVEVARQMDVDALDFLKERMEVTYPDTTLLQELCKPAWDEFPELSDWIEAIDAVK